MMTGRPLPAVRPTVIAPELVPERSGAVAFISHVRRDGGWVLPRNFRAVALMGNVELDLTSAHIGPGTSHIELMSVLGNITILVPPDLRVECDVDPVAGSVKIQREVQSTTSPDAPAVRITGSAFLASVEIKIVDPNAPGWFDKLRARLSSKNG